MDLTKDATAIEILTYYKSLVWPIIEGNLMSPVFPDSFKVSKHFEVTEKEYWEIARDYPERKGKYLRPTVLLLTSLAMGGTLGDSLNTAGAMQLSEEWILMQDDWEDDSPQRRGKPSAHIIHTPKLTINATSGLQAVMWNMLRKNLKIIGENKSNKIMEEFYLIISRTVLGQHVDINFVQRNVLEYSDEDWYFIADSKTSYYTIAGPIRLGAICANATLEQLEILAEFGVYLGRCFQIVDDLLDVTSDFDGLKQRGNDVYESKRTLLLGHLLRTIPSNEKKILIEIISKPRDKKNQEEVDWIIQKMERCGSIDYARDLAKQYKLNAEELLHAKMDFLKANPHRTHLKTLMNFILERKH